jgi:hypothetical protein
MDAQGMMPSEEQLVVRWMLIDRELVCKWFVVSSEGETEITAEAAKQRVEMPPIVSHLSAK